MESRGLSNRSTVRDEELRAIPGFVAWVSQSHGEWLSVKVGYGMKTGLSQHTVSPCEILGTAGSANR